METPSNPQMAHFDLECYLDGELQMLLQGMPHGDSVEPVREDKLDVTNVNSFSTYHHSMPSKRRSSTSVSSTTVSLCGSASGQLSVLSDSEDSDFGRRMLAAPEYPPSAATYFEESHPYRLRWAHAANSQAKLKEALASEAHFIEADVCAGYEQAPDDMPGGSCCNVDGNPVIMAHYPLETTSDLTLMAFIDEVLLHNERATRESEIEAFTHLASTGAPIRRNNSTRRTGDGPFLGGEEASIFAAELERELASSETFLSMGGCAGVRRDRVNSKDKARSYTRKGIKLDFKQLECVEPTLRYLRECDAVNRLGGHVWLNADVLAGPGALLDPIDPGRFVALCAEILPEAVLSMSWGASPLSAVRAYTQEMVNRMVDVCMTPGPGGEIPAHVCRHITFAISADYALASAIDIDRLLRRIPRSSLTIFSGWGTFGIEPSHVKQLVSTFRGRSIFLDVKLARASRSCTDEAAVCSLM